MKITLDSIVKQIISEAVTPVQFLMKAIKGLGKGAVEGENALIRAIKKEGNLGPKVAVDLNNVSEDLLNKAIKNSEFIAYRKLISQKLYSKNKIIIDDVVSKYKGKQRVLELNNAGIPPSFQEDVRNLSNKGRVKPTTPTNTPQSTTSNTPSVSSVLTDEELWGKLVNDFKDYNVSVKLTREQQIHFIQQIKPEINRLYKEIEPTLYKTYNETYDRYQKLTPEKRQLAIREAQKIIKKNGIGLKGYEKHSYNLQNYILSSIEKNKQNGWKSLKINAGLTIAGLFFEGLSNRIKTGEWNVENIFGFSFQQNALFKSLIALVSVFTNGVPSFLIALSGVIMSAISSVSALTGPDVSVQKNKTDTLKKILGDNPPSDEELDNLDNQ